MSSTYVTDAGGEPSWQAYAEAEDRDDPIAPVAQDTVGWRWRIAGAGFAFFCFAAAVLTIR
ncbi:MAG: hypothetical protein BGP06_07300 [Rhizobiales bacterium 65-9]|nr:hypothetical protein [Hyphomicrobiales bacterium]OJY35620.1 MAG: hypothetical protein BGP06_07300 [Rhizobiales bacterium 65-9]